jgi:uncharacterized protein YndB with AHSA1/START domain
VSEIRVEVDLPHPPDRVWRALTEPDLLSSWFLPTDLEPRAGRVFQAVPHRVPGFSGAFDIEVMGVLPARSLLMQWRGDQLHAQVTWEIDPSPAGSLLTVRQSGFLGVNGTLRRRELRRAYQEMFEERLPVAQARLARAEPVVPRQRSGHLIAAGRAQVVTHDVDNELPSAAPPQPNVPPAVDDFDDPSDPWALSDPLVSAGVGLPVLDEETPLPAPADGHARRTPLRRLAGAFPLEERVRAAAITVTVALIVVTVGWLWLTRPTHEDAPPLRLPQATGPAVGDQPGLILPSGVAPSAGATLGPLPSGAPGASGAPVVGVPSGSAAPQSSANPPPVVPGSQALTAAYGTESSTGLLGYKVKVTVTVHNPGGVAHNAWTVVLTVPSGADLQGSAASVDAHKDGGTVTITPKSGGLDGGATTVFDVTFGGGALLGIGSGGVTGCTVDGAACSHS